MKKEWKKPELEVLDVNMTMFGVNGEFSDSAFHDNNKSKKEPMGS
ncbi:paeninodin family lasso peptide [Paenisporosarcina antarctica]|uniref:Paeninodin family lasso peptide n=1 Tax=Paenisporosarcina antarctica TaxID=417367 RepID=A0A4P7A247_9BACL|nr:paeninodin family lasso peptide [Paenisporosarcina antarctica]QBP41996.1 paeninodin family lasso peptide [Paenisporosarcina antarctica]